MDTEIVVKKNFKYRLYPSAVQTIALDTQLAEACRLYNAALQERRDAYRMAGKSLNYCDQANQLKDIRAAGDLGLINAQCAQDVLRRLDKAFKAFFTRIKRGQTPGYPRFRSVRRYDSITFPTYGDGAKLLDNGKLRVQGVGQVKLKLHRPIEGTIKTVTVKREAGKWYAVFSIECEPLLRSRTEPRSKIPDITKKLKPLCGGRSARSLAVSAVVITERRPCETCSALTPTCATSERISRTKLPGDWLLYLD
jgi:putative transposase